ncbi:hypothetical protein [Fimbriiglobus ruber]|uniref:Uncharacterized protein n=1 Tax=Fimbriiglobus ruber TaxID=1908690 RepID=A0A225E708_9BACT|nr:hypothetical protein [Fimbriiglobus ruber]OWK45289.1 hypothetical protein FRUB_01620 [Fimbriiglobus ruber]
MPSRPGIGLILSFWLATTAFVGYRDVWPRFFSDAPPAVRIDLADEAAQALPARWTVFRGTDHIGSLTTRMEYTPADDTFRFHNTFTQLSFDLDLAKIRIECPRLETNVRVNRAGELREQSLSGEMKLFLGVKPLAVELGHAAAKVTGVVRDGTLVGDCEIFYPANATVPTITRALEPVPVPGGQVLNPMTPVGRLRDIQPGRRWVIRVVDPLRDAVYVMTRDVVKQSELAAGALGSRPESQELIAEVLSTPERLERKLSDPVDCWVIEYRGEGVEARTWVNVADGRVMRQEASGFGEKLRFERED